MPKLFAPTPRSSENFGYDVAFAGDRLLISAPLADVGLDRFGAVYLYKYVDDIVGWDLKREELKAPYQTGYGFGNSLATSGDHLLVGSRSEYAGAAYLYTWNDTTEQYEPTRRFVSPAIGQSHYFGNAVSFVGNNVLIGEYGADNGGTSYSGAAHLFDGLTGDWRATYLYPGPAEYARFGWAVAAFGNDILIGGPGPSSGSPVAGAVYRYGMTVATTTTDLSGNYIFSDLAAGEYRVREVLQSGYGQSFPVGNATHLVTVQGNDELSGVNFGNAVAPVATNDMWGMLEGQTLIVSAPGVLSNDTGADSDDLFPLARLLFRHHLTEVSASTPMDRSAIRRSSVSSAPTRSPIRPATA